MAPFLMLVGFDLVSFQRKYDLLAFICVHHNPTCYNFKGYTRFKRIYHHNIITLSKGSLKERQAQPHKRTRRFILGNPAREEIPAKLLLFRIRPSTV